MKINHLQQLSFCVLNYLYKCRIIHKIHWGSNEQDVKTAYQTKKCVKILGSILRSFFLSMFKNSQKSSIVVAIVLYYKSLHPIYLIRVVIPFYIIRIVTPFYIIRVVIPFIL